MTVKFLVENSENEDECEWRDMHINPSMICAWYLPDEDEDTYHLGASVNVDIGGIRYTMKQEPILQEYLLKIIDL